MDSKSISKLSRIIEGSRTSCVGRIFSCRLDEFVQIVSYREYLRWKVLFPSTRNVLSDSHHCYTGQNIRKIIMCNCSFSKEIKRVLQIIYWLFIYIFIAKESCNFSNTSIKVDWMFRPVFCSPEIVETVQQSELFAFRSLLQYHVPSRRSKFLNIFLRRLKCHYFKIHVFIAFQVTW